ncbi:MAG: hypothetical protein AAGE99_05050 [Chlamydiota bacterium]
MKKYFTLKSSGGDKGFISKTFAEPLLLDKGKKVFVTVLGLSCPAARERKTKPGVVLVFCSINGEEKKRAWIEAVEPKEKYYHCWKNKSADICVHSFLLKSIDVFVYPPRDADIHQPSVAMVKVWSEDEDEDEERRFFFTHSRAADDEASAHEFRAYFPEYLRDRKKCFQVALNSITFNPYFRIFPYVIDGSEPQYNVSFTSEEGITETKRLIYAELFNRTDDRKKAVHLGLSLIENLFVKNRTLDASICHIDNKQDLLQSDEKERHNINVTWLKTGTITLPKILAHFLSWEEVDMARDKFSDITRKVVAAQTYSFTIHQEKIKTWFPRNLQLEVDFILPNEEGSILKTMPVKEFAHHEHDYISFTPSPLEKHDFCYPCQEYLTFRLKTLDGSLAAFEKKNSYLFLDCVFIAENNKQ